MPTKRNPNAPYWLALEAREREVVEGALQATFGNVTRAAKALGIDRTHLTKRIQVLKIDRKTYAAPAPDAGEPLAEAS